MSFRDKYQAPEGGGSIWLTKEERLALAEDQTPFEITNVVYEPDNQIRGKTSPRYVVTLELPDPITGEGEVRKAGFTAGSNVVTRDDMLEQMTAYYEGDEGEATPANLYMAGNAYLINLR